MKKLTINNVDYAIYEIEGKRIYLKVLVQIMEGEVESEDFLIYLIHLIEKINFETAHYLNVNTDQF